MFTDEIRRALAVSPRAELTQLSSAIWKGYAAGAIGEHEAQQLAEEVEARKVVPTEPKAPARRVGSRPRSPASTERRRKWVAGGWLPPQLAARFTMGEIAVLAIVATETSRKGDCRLTINHIAAIAGVCATTVRNAMRAAAAMGAVTIEERRITYWRNASNIVRIVSKEWQLWARSRGRPAWNGGGCKTVKPTHTDSRFTGEDPAHERLGVFREKDGRDRGKSSRH